MRGGIFHLHVGHGQKEKQQKTGLPLLGGGGLKYGAKIPRSRSETRLCSLVKASYYGRQHLSAGLKKV